MSAPFDLPPVAATQLQCGELYPKLVELMQRLLAPDGCPWDREQTPQTLARFVLEEACEVIDAIESEEPDALCEELGDLALQIVFLGELARAKGQFGHDDVVAGICRKLVRRHPHVFGDGAAADPAAVERKWEEIKQREKGNRPLLDRIPRSLPALERAHLTSRQVARVGFDWPSADAARVKVDEELDELDREVNRLEPSAERVAEEYGDLLFALVSWGRHLGLEPERALRAACDKFRRRFDAVERTVREVHGDWPRDERGKPASGLSLDVLDGYWDAAKEAEDHG